MQPLCIDPYNTAKFNCSVFGTLPSTTSHELPPTSPMSTVTGSITLLPTVTFDVPHFQSNIFWIVLIVGVVIILTIVTGIVIICVVLVFQNRRAIVRSNQGT